MSKVNLFVYGTLRGRYDDVLSENEKVAGWWYDFGPFPGAVIDNDADGYIIGDVVRVDVEKLDEIDKYEGLLYKRSYAVTENDIEVVMFVLKEEPAGERDLKKQSGEWIDTGDRM